MKRDVWERPTPLFQNSHYIFIRFWRNAMTNNTLGNNPYGLRPVNTVGDYDIKATIKTFPIITGMAVTLCEGDLVIFDQANGGVTGLPAAMTPPTTAATAVRPIGVFAGCGYYNTSGEWVTSNTWIGGTQTFGNPAASKSPAEAYIYADPNMIFSVKTSSSVGTQASTRSGITIKAPGRFCNLNYAFTTAFPANAYFDDGTPLVDNPARASRANGISTAYADMIASADGIAATGVNTTSSFAMLQILGLAGTAKQFGSKSGALANQYLNLGVVTSIFSVRSAAATGPFPANSLQIADGAFSDILVIINNHAFSGNGFYA